MKKYHKRMDLPAKIRVEEIKEEKSSNKSRRRNPPTNQGGEILQQIKEEKSSNKSRRIGYERKRNYECNTII